MLMGRREITLHVLNLEHQTQSSYQLQVTVASTPEKNFSTHWKGGKRAPETLWML